MGVDNSVARSPRIGDERILGTAEKRVNVDIVVGDRDGGLVNRGEIQNFGRCASVGEDSASHRVVIVHGVDRTTYIHALGGEDTCCGNKVRTVVGIIAVTTAIDGTDADSRVCNTTTIAGVGTKRNG